MLFPKLKNIPTSKDMLDVFKGYNHNLRIGEGEFYEMTNLSSDDFPVLSQRPRRGVFADVESQRQGLLSKDDLVYVSGPDLKIGNKTCVGLFSFDNKPKTLLSMGTYVIVFPDLLVHDTSSDEFYMHRMNSYDYIPYNTELRPCRADGSEYSIVIVDTSQPDDYYNSPGILWIKNPSNEWHEYDNTEETWIPVEKYVKIYNRMFDHDFIAGERVTLEFPEKINGNKDYAGDLEGEKEIILVQNHAIIIKGQINEINYASQCYQMKSEDFGDRAIVIRSVIPNMDLVISCGNRLWGCRYSKDSYGRAVNEIYASKLGDFERWYCFQGISTDSFIASVGSDGPFTGAIEYRGNPIFFKENFMHIVYGDNPSNYQVKTVSCRGVQRGCERSLAILNEKLYYKSKDGICVFDGSLPVDISEALGSVSYKDAAAGVLKDKYYISMRDSADKWHMFVYDSSKGIWHREDDTHATCFCTHDGDLYYIDYADNSIKTVKGTVGALESSPVKWEAVSGILGTSSPDKKYISRLDVRMMLDVGSTVTFYAEYDSSGSWEHLFTMTGRPELRSFTVPVRPRRCDHLRLKICGVGEAKIFSICKTYETGSGD